MLILIIYSTVDLVGGCSNPLRPKTKYVMLTKSIVNFQILLIAFTIAKTPPHL